MHFIPSFSFSFCLFVPSVDSNFVEGVDVMVVRELTGDVYFGTPKGIDIIDGTYRTDEMKNHSIQSIPNEIES
jgi:isocitrate/isopropylmalate dehydrogenase